MSNAKAKHEESDWGSKRNNYYAKNKRDKGDDDFIEEEEEAKKIQLEKLQKLQKANLLESDEESIEEKKEIKKISLYSSDEEEEDQINNKPISSLLGSRIGSKGQKSLLSSKKTPEKTFSAEELAEFSQILKNIKVNLDELNENILPIEQVFNNEDIKLEKTTNYFKTKKQAHMLYLAYMTFYTYFKSLGKINDHHPVIKKMYFLKSIINSDKDKKDKIFEQLDKTLLLINEKNELEEANGESQEEEELEEEAEDEESQELGLNEEDGGSDDMAGDDFDLDKEDASAEDLEAEDILALQDDFDGDEDFGSKKNRKNSNKANKLTSANDNQLLNKKRNKPQSILDIDFSNAGNINSNQANNDKAQKNNKNGLSKVSDSNANNKNKDVNDFVNENIEKLQALKDKKEKIEQKNADKSQAEYKNKIEMGQRLANKNMLKARGIYRKRKQYQGNAKLHNREKYMKKQKLYKNMVKKYEGKPDVYGGETTGIRRDLGRSTYIK